MVQYEYETESIEFNMWKGHAKQDFLEVINERGRLGWRFVCFVPGHMRPKGVKHHELIFEREVSRDYLEKQ